MRIGLIGCAGLGKGIVCRILSDRLNIDFLESKEATRPVLKSAFYQYSEHSFVETRLAAKEHEFQIAMNRIQLEAEHESFVTDRTTCECFAYSFLRLETYSPSDFAMFEKTCQSHMKSYDRLYYIPFDRGWQAENGLRTVNREFQWMIDRLIASVIDRWRLVVVVPEGIDAETNAEWILNNIGRL